MRRALKAILGSTPLAAAPTRLRLPALLGLLLAYVICGRLGLMLALPPGYASAIFPPAGIAFAAVLCGGVVTLPWIFAGSLILNLWVGFDLVGTVTDRSFDAGVVVALASALQAAIGGTLLRRVLGVPTAMDHERMVLRFVLLTPLLCMIGASVAVFGLSRLGVLPPNDLSTGWATWWTGDTLGALVMLPLTMVLIGQPRALWRRRGPTLVVPVLIGSGLLIAIFIRFSEWEQGQSLLEFRMTSRQVAERVQTQLQAQEALLEQTERFFQASDEVTPRDFAQYVDKALQRYPMTLALEWLPSVPAAQRAAYEARTGFAIRELDAHNLKLRRAGARSVYYPVTYVQPPQRNAAVIGLDIASRLDPAMLQRAAVADAAVAGPPLVLIQDLFNRDVGLGAFILYPVKGSPTGSGFIAAVLRMQDFLGVVAGFASSDLVLEFEDIDAGRVVYSSFQGNNVRALFEQAFSFGGRHYVLRTAPTPAYLASHRGWQSWGMLVAGLLFMGLLTSVLLLATGHGARTEAEVAERTAALRDEKAFSETVINSLPGVFYVLDAAGRLLRWNRHFQTVFGGGDTDLRQREFLDSVVAEDRPLARRTMAQVSSQHGQAEVELRQQVAGGQQRRYLTHSQYVEISGQPYVIGTGLDVTDRREMEQEVQRNRTVLRTLIDAASVWLAMIDRSGRMVIANRRFAETFGLQQAFIEGKHYSAVLPPETSIRMQSLFDTSFSGREIEFNDEWNVIGRPTIYVHGKCVPVMDAGVVVSVVLAIMDLTEMHHAQSSLRTANLALERRVEEIRGLQAKLQEQAIRDPLTGLYNRRYLDETLERELSKAQRAGYPVSIVMGDIDRFKKLNDTYGHQAGDQVIRALAALMAEQVRSGDILCRYGGEEFLLVLPGMSRAAAGERVDRLREAFAARQFEFGTFHLSATISFGIAAYPEDGRSADRLIGAADQALYTAKANGRNRVEQYLARATDPVK